MEILYISGTEININRFMKTVMLAKQVGLQL